MKKLPSINLQNLIFLGFLGMSLAGFIYLLFVYEKYLVNRGFIAFFNFMSEIDPSGALVFAGIAAGLTYTKATYFFYRNLVFMFGFVFAISQAGIAAVGSIYILNKHSMFLVYITFVSGVGFITSSFIAMAAHEHEKRKAQNSGSKSEDTEPNNKYINLDPSSKNDSAQPSPAPSDLAHDLRYSRSRARRSRAQR